MVNIPREMPDLTPQQRRDNWWRYHWLYVLAGVLAVLTAAGIAWERFARAEYDCGAALVTRYAVTQEELSALKTALETAAGFRYPSTIFRLTTPPRTWTTPPSGR